MPVTGITWLLIVITSDPTIPLPSLAVALAVTVPLATAVTSPVVLIVAWPVPLTIDQVTVLFVASVGVTVAVNCSVPLSVVISDDAPGARNSDTRDRYNLVADRDNQLSYHPAAVIGRGPGCNRTTGYCCDKSCRVDRRLACAVDYRPGNCLVRGISRGDRGC